MLKVKDRDYPSRVLVDEIRKRDIPCRLMWEIKGPKDTQIAWITCYLIQRTIVHVLTYTGKNGWDALTPCQSLKIDETVQEVLDRTR
jgi:hypothetical protein